MVGGTGRSALRADVDDVFFDYLRSSLDDVCSDLAGKFDLYNSRGEPRKAFILDTLLKYSCCGCIVKVLTRQRRSDRADMLFIQNHKLAVNLLVERLRRRLKLNGFKPEVEGEAGGVYGRPDVIVKPTIMGVVVEVAKTLEIIIEVKTGTGFTYAQLFRYLIGRPNAVLLVWRVTRRQVLVIDGKERCRLLILLIEAALDRGTAILNDEYEECSHNPVRDASYTIEDAQGIVDEFLTALVETIPNVVESVVDIIQRRLQTTGISQITVSRESLSAS